MSKQMFNQIVCVDKTGLTEHGYIQLQNYSQNKLINYSDYPTTTDEIITRIKDADCVLVSWNTQISAEALQAAKKLKYVGMCCSLYDPASANVDIQAAQTQNITVRGVRDYGDEGVVEFIMAQLISLYKGLGKLQWGAEPTELSGKKLGIIGLGTTGQMVAQMARHFGMRVWYTSRTRKEALESEHVQYAPLHELLTLADVVTTHLPKRTILLGAKEFSLMKPGSILVNTSLGPTFNVPAFCDWIENGRNFAIFDADATTGHVETFAQYPNIIMSNKVSGWTVEARGRLTEKVLANIQEYLAR